MTFSGVTLGTGLVVVAIADDNLNTYSAVVINGNSATQASAATGGLGVYYAANTGSSGTITFTASNVLNNVCITLGYFTGLSSNTPTCSGSCPTEYQNNTYPQSLGATLTVNSGGYGIVAVHTNASVNPFPLTWTGATEDTTSEKYDTGGPIALSLAHMTASADPAFNCTAGCSTGTTASIMATGAWR